MKSFIYITVIIFSMMVLTYSKPKPIDIHDQNGLGDIVQLWPSKARDKTVEDFNYAMIYRNALKPDSLYRWIKYNNKDQTIYYIPYIISGTFKKEEKLIIKKAMQTISNSVCIKFRRRKFERDYVDIQNQRGILHPTVIHELFHTIGLWHEQMRSDRDKFIKIRYENIAPENYAQFETVSKSMSTTYGVKYDYLSVMHYRKNAFSINGKITMQTTDPRFQDIIGTVKEASIGDYSKICDIYQCQKCMGYYWTKNGMRRRRKRYNERKRKRNHRYKQYRIQRLDSNSN